MPPERKRTSNAQGRQKSCSECAKSKRKCDLRTPHCLRCRRQHLTCIYPPQPQALSADPQEISMPHDDSIALDDYINIPDNDETLLPFDLDVAPIAPVSDVDLVDFDFSSGVRSLEALHDLLDNPSPNPDSMAVSRPLRTERCIVSSDITPFMRSRLDYSIEQLKLSPEMMVMENATFWSHRMLYEDGMPKPLQTAVATCALFIARNGRNGATVARHITDHTNELIKLPFPTAPRECLARAHALMLYQIMAEFGTDLRFYGLTDSLFPHLQEMSQRLFNLASEQVDPVGTLSLYPSSSARSVWISYIFRESVRRTLLAMVQLMAVCSFLHGRMSSCDRALSAGNRVTVSAHLWEAECAFDFALAWNEKKHFLVKEMDFNEVLKEAKPDDLDSFTKMILAGIMGADDIKGWFHLRGGVF